MADYPEKKARHGLLLSDDLIFSSRIVGTARDLGRTIKGARSSDALYALAEQESPGCVIVDLSHPGLKIADLIQRLNGICSLRPRIIAYGSHVDVASLRAAKDAGCDVVLPRSKFVKDLPSALPEWLVD